MLIAFVSGLTVYVLLLVSFAVLVGRSRGLTGQPGYWRSALFPLAPILGLMLAVVFGVADLLDADAGRPSLLILGAIIGAGLLWLSLIHISTRGAQPLLRRRNTKQYHRSPAPIIAPRINRLGRPASASSKSATPNTTANIRPRIGANGNSADRQYPGCPVNPRERPTRTAKLTKSRT